MSKLNDIATALGTSRSTVSRALRNDARISLEMRRRVACQAERSGYAPDPGISAAMRRVRSGDAAVNGVIGLWWPGGTTEQQLRRRYPILIDVLDSVRAAAEALHFACEPCDGLPDDPDAAARAMEHRGVAGLLLFPGAPEVYQVPEAFSKWAAVAVGNAVQGRVDCRVTTHFEDSYAQIYEQLHARGYRRPGPIVRHNARKERLYEARYLGAYEHSCKRLGWFEPVEPHWVGDPRRPESVEDLRAWLKREEPDAIVLPHAPLYPALKERDDEFRIPERMGCAATGATPKHPELSGPQTDGAAHGREAVHALVNRLRTLDADAAPDTRVLIKPTWHEGASLPSRRDR